MKLFGQRRVDWRERGHSFAIAAQLMRRILVDHARRELRRKRGAASTMVAFDDALASPASPVDVVSALDLECRGSMRRVSARLSR